MFTGFLKVPIKHGQITTSSFQQFEVVYKLTQHLWVYQIFFIPVEPLERVVPASDAQNVGPHPTWKPVCLCVCVCVWQAHCSNWIYMCTLAPGWIKCRGKSPPEINKVSSKMCDYPLIVNLSALVAAHANNSFSIFKLKRISQFQGESMMIWTWDTVNFRRTMSTCDRIWTHYELKM